MIRRATPTDAEALSHLSRTCFTQTFGHLYAPSDLEAFLDEAYSPTVLRTELNDPERATWLLFDEPVDEARATLSSDDLPGTPEPRDEAPTSSVSQAPIGYVTACPAHLPHPDVAPGDGEVQRLYILQGHQGGGRGTALLRTALDWLERDGPRTIWIGVWSENYGAQRFYARHGFEIVGDYSFMVGDHADHELITRRLPRAITA
ncbi:GNAT family N-acetyltransferase [Pauljensenia sp. UMB3104]|uniref:GNAT family N-acetyltransferase n=1 Tax=Pauljensenia sp. UMB3104 TaxID=3046331 RepID=UPI00254E13CB|nr:GNAT family N-acetyltransferase [Pauljensenia sp. UMB3104]MDK7159420.1 GNAT family N-acetyltransferase [Pauljensenia sp. UMB3104]